jgi:hypothetical protein
MSEPASRLSKWRTLAQNTTKKLTRLHQASGMWM